MSHSVNNEPLMHFSQLVPPVQEPGPLQQQIAEVEEEKSIQSDSEVAVVAKKAKKTLFLTGMGERVYVA